MRLRPYKSCDAQIIEKWIKDEEVFKKWGGELFGPFPIDAGVIDDKYCKKNGGCVEADNFYPWTAVDDENNVVGHFIMRYLNGDPKCLRFGWVIVDTSKRGKGYGKQMLKLGLKYAFEIMGVDKVTLGAFVSNEPAHKCYQGLGFKDTHIVEKEPWNVYEMEYLRENY